MNWWLSPEKLKKDRILPPVVVQTLISARQKYEQKNPWVTKSNIWSKRPGKKRNKD